MVFHRNYLKYEREDNKNVNHHRAIIVFLIATRDIPGIDPAAELLLLNKMILWKHLIL